MFSWVPILRHGAKSLGHFSYSRNFDLFAVSGHFRVRGPQKSIVSKNRDSKGEPNEGEVADYGKKQEKDKIPCELKNEPKT